MSMPTNGHAPHAPAPARLAVLRVENGEKLRVRSLSEAYGGLYTHWKQRSIYCPGEGECTLCRKVPDRIWKGYFPGEVWEPRHSHWLPVVMEVTEACELDLRHRFGRGQVWLFSRLQQVGPKKTPVTASLVEQLNLDALPAPFDLYAVLRTLYHYQHIGLTHANPLPDRVMVKPSAGAPPADLVPKREDREKRTFREIMDEMEAAKRIGSIPGAEGNGLPH